VYRGCTLWSASDIQDVVYLYCGPGVGGYSEFEMFCTSGSVLISDLVVWVYNLLHIFLSHAEALLVPFMH
jgi:hypothetical protein